MLTLQNVSGETVSSVMNVGIVSNRLGDNMEFTPWPGKLRTLEFNGWTLM